MFSFFRCLNPDILIFFSFCVWNAFIGGRATLFTWFSTTCFFLSHTHLISKKLYLLLKLMLWAQVLVHFIFISLIELKKNCLLGVCLLRKLQDVDAGLLSIHPACVVSVSLSHLRTESFRQRKVIYSDLCKYRNTSKASLCFQHFRIEIPITLIY